MLGLHVCNPLLMSSVKGINLLRHVGFHISLLCNGVLLYLGERLLMLCSQFTNCLLVFRLDLCVRVEILLVENMR